MLGHMAVQNRNAWMNDAVVLLPNGSIIRGSYDGYGRLSAGEVEVENAVYDNQVFHFRCWEAAGRPTEFTAPSRHSVDQGWFFADDAHNWRSPAEAKAHPPKAA
ncbi:MAG TPA: hypothetical protein VHD87_12970 [Acidimicrobiales bacterium]|nr:hypothetical protein [Acidimicrobiales bacterium]